MVLQKVGEFLSTISVNGSQQASYDQSSDSNYDVSISTSSSPTPGSFNITNVNGVSFYTESGSIYVHELPGGSSATVTVDMWAKNDSGNYLYVEITDATGTTYKSGEIQYNGGTWSDTFTMSGIQEIWMHDGGGGNGWMEGNYDLQVNIPISSSSSYSVNGVNKS